MIDIIRVQKRNKIEGKNVHVSDFRKDLYLDVLLYNIYVYMSIFVSRTLNTLICTSVYAYSVSCATATLSLILQFRDGNNKCGPYH